MWTGLFVLALKIRVIMADGTPRSSAESFKDSTFSPLM